MKIEKLSENQIRCTLTREDLENHQLRISELAYGSEKTKQLFRDMMQQAHIQFGFEADNIPLMIEAIPISAETIVLIITKVEDPEELDTRFAKFAPLKEHLNEALELDGADSIIDIFKKIHEANKAISQKLSKKDKNGQKGTVQEEAAPVSLIRLYVFRTLDDVIAAAHGLNGFFTGTNALYKDPDTDRYLLVLHQSGHTPEDFNKVCNILSEYGAGRAFTAAGEAYFKEHGCLITEDALESLIQL